MDPKGEFEKIISTVSKLLAGSDDDRTQTRQTISEMPTNNITEVSEKDSRKIKEAINKVVSEYDLQNPQVIDEAWSNVDHMILSQTRDKEGSALLQVDSTFPSAWSWAVVSVCIILLFLL